jgi:hypothetical protein
VQGSAKGLEQIKARLQEEGIASLYSGAVAQALATAVSEDMGEYIYISCCDAGFEECEFEPKQCSSETKKKHTHLTTTLSTVGCLAGRALALLPDLQLPVVPHPRAAPRPAPAAPRPQRVSGSVETNEAMNHPTCSYLGVHRPFIFPFYFADVHPRTHNHQCLNTETGLCASTVSDCCSNSIRVIKTTKQTSESNVTYKDAVRQIIEKDGVLGLLGRGLQTRLAVNALQGMVFSVAWRFLEESGFFAFK